jgi:hypothetical protein
MRRIVWLFSLFAFLSGPTQLLNAAEPFLVFQPHGHAKGKNIVLISGDEEYRPEESMPQLAKILSTYHGFHCTVLFAINPKDVTIDPNQLDNIPGLEALAAADERLQRGCRLRLRGSRLQPHRRPPGADSRHPCH